MILTDFLSVIPGFLLGIELLRFGEQKEHSFLAWVYGHIARINPDAVQIWIAECSLKDKVHIYGVIFITFAVCAMLMCMLVGLATAKYLERPKNEWDEKTKLELKDSASVLWYVRNLKRARREEREGFKVVESF